MKKIKWMMVFLISMMLIPSYIKSKQHYKVLSGITIVLDSGHGGKDMGASYQEVYEAPLNLIIVRKLEKALTSLGCNVVLTRRDENDLASSEALNRKKEDMEKRIQIINDEKNDLFISIHMNQYQSEDVKGFHVFYTGKSDSSMALANDIQESANYILNQNKQIKKGDFYILNNSRIQGVLIECGFISNAEDRKNLNQENYQNEIVKCITEGLMQYFEDRGMN